MSPDELFAIWYEGSDLDAGPPDAEEWRKDDLRAAYKAGYTACMAANPGSH